MAYQNLENGPKNGLRPLGVNKYEDLTFKSVTFIETRL
jgi:hypothetical protein